MTMLRGNVMAEAQPTSATYRIVGPDGLDQPPGPRPETVTLRSQAVERVVAAMRDRLDEPLPLEAMADVAALSLYHFARVFHHMTGVTPARFLTALRLAEAKRLLLTTSLSVTNVCYRVGYNSLGSFTVRFTQSVGLSPGRFRQLPHNNSMPDLTRWSGPGIAVDASEAGTGEVAGRVFGPTAPSGPVFVGLFRTPIPEGQPVRCTVLPRPGGYRMTDVPEGTYHLFAACFPRCDDRVAPLLADDRTVQVGSVPSAVRISHGAAIHDLDLWLRAVQPTDPPILVALPSAALDADANGTRKRSKPREAARARPWQDS
jgi:AraC family transcriptional regulator